MKKIMLLGMIVILVGCVTGCAHNYSKTGASIEQLNKAKSDCLVASNQAGLLRTKYHKEFMDGCMAGEGWARN